MKSTHICEQSVLWNRLFLQEYITNGIYRFLNQPLTVHRKGALVQSSVTDNGCYVGSGCSHLVCTQVLQELFCHGALKQKFYICTSCFDRVCLVPTFLTLSLTAWRTCFVEILIVSQLIKWTRSVEYEGLILFSEEYTTGSYPRIECIHSTSLEEHISKLLVMSFSVFLCFFDLSRSIFPFWRCY
jgi:hypothetical protein